MQKVGTKCPVGYLLGQQTCCSLSKRARKKLPGQRKRAEFPLDKEDTKESSLVTSLVVQWLRFPAPNAGGMGSIHGRGTKIPHSARSGQKKKKKVKEKKEKLKEKKRMQPNSNELAGMSPKELAAQAQGFKNITEREKHEKVTA